MLQVSTLKAQVNKHTLNCHSYETVLFLTTLSAIVILFYKNQPNAP